MLLQREKFRVLVGCAPGLAEQVEGRLGLPLSEEPEFWRAAPDAAIDWGSEEFDLPRPQLEREEEGADLQGVSGLLRASGLRL